MLYTEHTASVVVSVCVQVLQHASFISKTGIGEEVHLAHGQLVQTLDELVRRMFSEWSQNLDRQCLKKLDQPLMVRCKEKPGMLDVNFDKYVPPHTCTHMLRLSLRNVYIAGSS